MHRLVASCFKAIMFSIIFVFVFDMSFYLYRVISLNSRRESIMTSMQKVIMENNYLPDGSYKLYENIFSKLASDMNQGGEVFIRGFNINYSHDATLPAGEDTLNANIVYANGGSSSSNKYHSTKDAHNMKGAVKMTEKEAKSKGYVPCGICY